MTWTQQAYEEIMRERQSSKKDQRQRVYYELLGCDCDEACECTCGRCGCCS